MLPASLVQQVVVKNTFLDFDDSCLKRSYKRYKTEGAINAIPRVEYYDHSSDSDSTSPASSGDGSSISSSGFTDSTHAEILTSPRAGEQLNSEQEREKPRWSDMSSSEATGTSDKAAEGASIASRAPREAPTVHHWKVDAKKLRGNDRSVVSRAFTLAIGGPGSVGITCKMMLCAKSLSHAKAGQSFRLSGGQGSVQLKCEHDLSGSMQGPVSLRFSVGSGQGSKLVQHNFSQSASCASQVWDFVEAVDKSTQTFVVSVEVVTA